MVVVPAGDDLESLPIANYLGDTERQRLSSYTYPKRRTEWLGGRIAAKYAILMIDNPENTELQDTWLSLEIKSEKDGRPVIHDTMHPERLMADISISHSHGMAAGLAFGRGRCGVDIQQITSTVEKVKERFVDTAEEAVVAALPMAGSGSRPLTLLWAAKEALRKAVGTKVLPGFLGIIKVCAARQGIPGGPLGEHMILDCSLIPHPDAVKKSTTTFPVAAIFLGEYVLAFTGLKEKM